MQLLFQFENEHQFDCIINDILNEWDAEWDLELENERKFENYE